MSRLILLALGSALLLFSPALSTARAAEGGWPEGQTVAENSTSPDGRFGVLLPDREHADVDDDEKIVNTLVDLKTHKQLAVIRNSHYFPGRNHSDLSVTWGADSTCCVVVFDGRFGFDTITALEFHGAAWTSTDLGKAIQKGLDAGISQQAKKATTGSCGSAHFRPVPGRQILVRATSLTNPKAFEDQPTYNALFQGTYDLAAGKWIRSEGRGIRNADDFDAAYDNGLAEDTTFNQPGDRLQWFDGKLNAVYGALRTILPPARFAAVKKEQVAWLKQLEARQSIADKCDFMGARIKQLQELLW